MKRIIVFFIFLLLAYTSVANATTYWVSPSLGNTTTVCATASGSTPPAAYIRTFKAGVACLIGSDTLYVRAGTYAEQIEFTTAINGAPGAYTKILAYQNELPTVVAQAPNFQYLIGLGGQYIQVGSDTRGQGFIFDGAGLRVGTQADGNDGSNCIEMGSAVFDTFSNNEVKNCDIHGVRLIQQATGGHNSLIGNHLHHIGTNQAYSTPGNVFYCDNDNNLFEYNTIHDTTGIGIRAYDNAGVSNTGNVIRFNTIYDWGGGIGGGANLGAIEFGGHDNFAYGNVIHDPKVPNSTGINIRSNAPGQTNNQLYNNTIVNPGGPGIKLSAGGFAAFSSIVKNNIVSGNVSNGPGGGNFLYDEAAGSAALPSLIESNNLCGTGVAGCGAGDFTGDPLFINPALNDYHLQSGSPAKDHGVTIASIPAVDMDGTARAQGPAWDIGAYEFFTSGSPPIITVSSPLNPFVTTTSTIIFNGTASCPSSSITNVTWVNNMGGFGTASGTTAWNMTGSGAALTADKVNAITTTVNCADKTTASATNNVAYSVPGLAASYAFDENTGTSTVDSSGNGNTGTFGAGVAWNASGKYGSALTFSTGALTVPNSATLQIIGGFAISLQAFPNASHVDFRSLLAKGSVPYNYALYGTVAGYCGDGSPLGIAAGIVCNPSPLPINTWSCLAVTYDGVNMKMYLNKSLVQTTAVTGLPTVNTANLIIGNSDFTEPFTGSIDNVRIWKSDIGQSGINSDCDTPVISVPNPVTVLRLSATNPILRLPAGAVLRFHSQ